MELFDEIVAPQFVRGRGMLPVPAQKHVDAVLEKAVVVGTLGDVLVVVAGVEIEDGARDPALGCVRGLEDPPAFFGASSIGLVRLAGHFTKGQVAAHAVGMLEGRQEVV